MTDEIMSVDLDAVFGYLKRRLAIITVLSLIVGGITWGYLKKYPTYESKAILTLQPSNSKSAAAFDMDDLRELALSPQVLAQTKKTFGHPTLPSLDTGYLPPKKLVLLSRGNNPRATTDSLTAWIKTLTQEYERTVNAASKTPTTPATATRAAVNTIQPLLLPGEPTKPLYSPIRYGVAGFLLTFGLLFVVTLLLGAYSQNKTSR